MKAAERIDYTVQYELVYKCHQGVAPSYLADELSQTEDTEARRRLRSASSSSLIVRRTRLSTVGDRAFPVAAPRVWNGLPQHVSSAQSLAVFRSLLETQSLQALLPMTSPLSCHGEKRNRHWGHVSYLGLLSLGRSGRRRCLSRQHRGTHHHLR